MDSAGNLYIADTGNNRIRKVSNGVITTVAGNGTPGFSGDNGPATSAQLIGPHGRRRGFSRQPLHRGHRQQPHPQGLERMITTVAGTAGTGFSGDNGPATSAQLNHPDGIAVDSAGNLYIADPGNNRIRKVSNGVITTVAGNGTRASAATTARPPAPSCLDPEGVAVDSAGNLYIADTLNYRIRKVSNGVITTVAGNGTQGYSGDGGPATSAQFRRARSGIAVDYFATCYTGNWGSNRVRLVTPSGVPRASRRF